MSAQVTNVNGRKHFVETVQPPGLFVDGPIGAEVRKSANTEGKLSGKLAHVSPRSIADVPEEDICPPSQSVNSKRQTCEGFANEREAFAAEIAAASEESEDRKSVV